MTKIRAAVIDDEPNARRALVNMLRVHCPEVEVSGEAGDVEEALALIEDTHPDLLFLDVEMPGGTGFDLLSQLPPAGFRVIFVTAHEQYALRAIRFSALDYLLKPVHPGELVNAVERSLPLPAGQLPVSLAAFRENMTDGSRKPSRLVVNTATRIYVLDPGDIIRCEADVNYTFIFTTGGEKILASRTMKDLEDLLTEYGFFRVHQSHLINLSFINHYRKGDGGHAVLKNGEQVPVSSRRKEVFVKLLSSL